MLLLLLLHVSCAGTSAGSGRRAWLLLNQSLAELTTNIGAATLNGTQIQLVIEDTESTLAGAASAVLRLGNAGVAAILGGAQGLNLVNNQPVVVAAAQGTGVGVGPGSAETSMLAWTASTLPLPRTVVAVSPSACSRRDFSDQTLYPYLNRMCVKPSSKAQAMLQAFDEFGWKKVAIFAQDDADGWGANLQAYMDPTGNIMGPGQAEADFIVEQLAAKMTAKRAKKDILRLRIPMQPTLARDQIPLLLSQLQDSGIRIVVVYVQGTILVELLRQAAGLGMMQYPYVWVGAGSNAGPASTAGLGTGTVASGGMGAGLCSNSVIAALADLTPAIPSVASSAGRLVSSFQSSTIGASSSAATFIYQADLALTSSPLMGAICFTPSTPSSPAFTNLKYRLQSAQGLPFESILNMADASTYDALSIVAKAVGALMSAQTEFSPNATAGQAVWSPDDMYAAITASSLTGAQGLSGTVQFDSNGDKIGVVDLLNYDPLGSASGSFVRRGAWSQASNGFNFTDAIIWADATAVLPPDHVDRFDEGQVIVPTLDGRIIALAYFYVLLPSALLIYNTRRSIKAFIDTQGGAGGDRSWIVDHTRAFAAFSVCGVFAMHHLNLLAMSFVTGIGDISLSQDAFAGGLCMCFLLGVCVAMLPLFIETWWGVRKGGAEALAIAEDFELHMENGEEIAAPAEAAANAKNKDEVKKLAPSAKEKARAARAKARKGGLSSNDEGNILERELDTLWEKMTPGLVLSAAMFAGIISGLFFLSIQGIILPLVVKIDAGKAFGAWVLETLCMVVIFVRAFKDSRNFARVFSVFLGSAVLLMSFHVNLSAVTFRYRTPTETEEDYGLVGSDRAVDLGAIAIAHAILFAIPFFAGLLQLIKALKLSRHSLDSILGNMKSKLATLEAGLDAAKAERKATAADTDHLKRLLELSNLCRPLHRNHALAFTMAETTGSSGPESGAAGGAEKKPFIPASFTQDMRFGAAARTVQGAVGTPKFGAGAAPGTPTKAAGNLSGGPASPSVMDTARSVNMSAVKLVPDTPGGGHLGAPSAPGTPIRRSAGMGGPSVALSAAASERAANLSQGIAAANLTGLDFGFLARPKAEQTGYKLLNELSLELFLASGPVHHRAVADITLSHVLSHPLTLELFKDSLTRSGSQEALAFWLDIQRFKQLEGEELRKQIAEAMTATFLYSDAPHPVHFLTPASREGVLNVIFAKKPPKRALFHFVEQELLAHLQKEHANFATTTSFKVTAFLLGHSSYRPSTRIKTLNAGGAAVGAGGALVQMTQNQGPAEHSGSNQAAGAGVNASVVMTGAPGAGGFGNNFDPESSMGGGGAASRMAAPLTVDIAKPAAPSAVQRKDSSAGGASDSPKASKLASPQHASGGTSPGGLNRSLLLTAAFNNASAAAASSSSQPPSPMPRDAATEDDAQASAPPTVKLHFGTESAAGDDGVAAAVAATTTAASALTIAPEDPKEKEESRGSEDDETKPLSPKQDSSRKL